MSRRVLHLRDRANRFRLPHVVVGMTRHMQLACTLSALAAVAGLALPATSSPAVSVDQIHASPAQLAATGRTGPNGKAVVIKVPSNLKWGDHDRKLVDWAEAP